jgi:hypothetical protein
MGMRAGQGFGRQKPKRLRCPDCAKKGVTQPKLCVGAVTASWVRDCQYCGGSWTELGWEVAKKTPAEAAHLSHPWKVEAREYRNDVRRSVLIGRAMFKTREEAAQFADGAEGSRVLASKPGDTVFA